jgi:biotin carboxyl carrier protein
MADRGATRRPENLMAAPRTFVAELVDRTVPVEIEELGQSRYRVKLDGATETVEGRLVGPNRLSLLIGGRNYLVSVARASDDYDVLVANQRYRFRLLDEAKARRTVAAAREGARGRRDIKASMPGKVVDVLVKVGDVVEPNQGLLVVEAMKMENEIRSPGPGEVKEIRVKPGQAVEGGELLLVVE